MIIYKGDFRWFRHAVSVLCAAVLITPTVNIQPAHARYRGAVPAGMAILIGAALAAHMAKAKPTRIKRPTHAKAPRRTREELAKGRTPDDSKRIEGIEPKGPASAGVAAGGDGAAAGAGTNGVYRGTEMRQGVAPVTPPI